MKTDLIAIAGLLAAAAVSFGLASMGDPSRAATARTAGAPSGDVRSVEDARGATVVAAEYTRIVSMNPLADHLLAQLVEPQRLIAVHELSADGHPESWRFDRCATTTSDDSVERILELRPDLVVASPFVEESVLTRLRELGIAAVDTGPMRGVETTLTTIERLGAVLQLEERADALTARYQRELAALCASAEKRGRVQGMYLAIYGDTFFGGTAGTSYGDVLHHGGIDDVAAAAGHTNWPQYSSEELISIDPELLITQEGMAQTLRDHPVTSKLRATQTPGAIIELPAALNSDAGLGVIRGAELLSRALEQRLAGAPSTDIDDSADAPRDQ